MNAIIIEDEHLIADELQYKIRKIDADISIQHILPSVKLAKKWFLENAEPDLIFADIQLSDGVSFEIFTTFQLKCPVIFTTAYDEFAIQAFKVNGTDYLLKPVDEDELERAIFKAKEIIKSKSPYPKEIQQLLSMISSPKDQLPAYREKFIVKQRNNWVPILTKDIACFYRENLNYLCTFSGEKYILEFATLEEIEELLNPAVFYRANRQSIVHIDAIQRVKLHDNQKLTLTLLPELKMTQDVSREKAPSFKKWFER